MKEAFSFDKVNSETVSPQISSSPTWMNKISHEVGMSREIFLVKQIEQRLNEYSSVLVAYGSGHLVKQRQVLLEGMGEPQNEKRF